MAITTIDGRSEQEGQINTNAADKLKANELHSRVRRSYFSYEDGTDATLDTDSVMNIAMTRIPAGARIVGGYVDTDDFGTGWTLDVGVAAVDGTGEIDSAGTSDDVDYLTGAVIDINSAGTFNFGNTQANNFGAEIEKETLLTFQFASSGSVTKATTPGLRGYVEYLVD